MAYKLPIFTGDSRTYELWEIKFLGYMRLKKLNKIFSDENCDPEDNAEVFAELIQCIDDRSLSLVMRDAKDKGKEALDILRTHYRPKGKSTIISLYQELTSLSLSSEESITDYIIRAETAANALRNTGESVSDSLLISMVLKGLPKSYQSFITVTTQRETPQNFSDFKESLRNQEETVRSEDSSVMTFQQRPKTNYLWCDFCKSSSHSTNRCYKKSLHNMHGQNSSSAHSHHNGRRQDRRSYCTKCKMSNHDTKFCKRFCDIHNTDSHWTSQCRNKQNHHAKQANVEETPTNTNNENDRDHSFTFMLDHVTQHTSRSLPQSLLIDSGASTHILTDKNLFKSFKKDFGVERHVIELANGEKINSVIEGCGDAIVFVHDSGRTPRAITLKNTLYIPTFKQNILSVSAATTDGATIKFHNNGGTIEYNGFIFNLFKSRNLYFINNVVNRESKAKSLLFWHQALGHCNVEDILKLAKKGDIYISDPNSKLACETCVLGKMSDFRNRQPDAKAKQPLEKVHLDLAGPIDPAAREGFKYVLICVDDHTGINCVYFLKNKSDTPKAFQKYLADLSPFGQVKCVRTDGGGEFISTEFKNILVSNKIRHELSSPFSPHQNGTAERQWRTLFDMARCLLIDSGLPKMLWSYAIMISCYIRNRCYSNRLSKTPFEALTGKKPDFEKMQIFGQTCFALQQNTKKLDARAKKGIFVGYDKESPAHLVFFPDDESVRKIRCVRFHSSNANENYVPMTHEPNCEENEFIFTDNFNDKPTNTEKPYHNLKTTTPEKSEVPLPLLLQNPSCENDEAIENQSDNEPTNNAKTVPENSGMNQNRTRRKPKYLDDYYLDEENDNLCMMTHYCYNVKYNVPETYSEAMGGNEKHKWNEAMMKEMNALKENDTYDIVPLPKGRECVGGKWVYAVKTDQFGKETFKARYVAKGYSQIEGIDYNETFSPTTRMSSIRLFTQLAIENDFEIHQMDVKAAFLNAPIDCEIYVEQPKGFELKSKNDNEYLVLKLKKSLYGLKQSGRNWNNLLDTHLQNEGFTRSINDPCVYFKPNNKIFLLVWVDDLLIASKADAIKYTKKTLEENFQMKDLGRVSYFLGMQFENNENDEMTISQRNYIETLLERFDMQNCKANQTPCEMKPCNHDSNCQPLNDEHLKLYKQIVGALIYIMTATRPDISYTVTKLSQYMHNARKCHMVMAKHALRYLRGTINEKLTFRKSGPLNITGFCDADWANSDDRKSITGYCFQISTTGPLISWKSRKQPTVALSTCEAEYMSLVSAAQEGKYLISIINEITSSNLRKFHLFGDNQGAIALAKNPIKHQRSKHVDIKYHFIRDEITKENLVIDYVPSENNVADMFTKPVSKIKLQVFKKHLMG